MPDHQGHKVFVWNGEDGVNFEAVTDDREPTYMRFVWSAHEATEVAEMLLRQAANALEADRAEANHG